MNKPVKITLISLGSILVVALIAVSVALWYVFTPEKLTPIVRNILEKNIKCETKLDKVELTFFSTFPHLGLKINKLALINSIYGSPSDTLLSVDNTTGTIDLMRFILKNEVVINKFLLKDGFVNAYTDSLGNSNYDIFPADTTKKEKSTIKMPDFVDFKSLELNNVKLSYIDEKNGINSHINNLNITLSAEMKQLDGKASIKLNATDITFVMNDTAPLNISMKNIDYEMVGKKDKSNFNGTIQTDIKGLNFISGKDKIVDNKDINISLPINGNLDSLLLNINKGVVELQKSRINISGWLKKQKENINLDLGFHTDLLNINDVLNLLPPNIKFYFNDMTFDGKIDVSGVVQGSVGNAAMPKITADVNLKNGGYQLKGLPYILRDMNGNALADIDLNEKGIYSLKINNLSLKTKNSSATINGKIDDLTNKMLCDMSLSGNINLADVQPMLSDTMKISGLAKTNLHGIFTIDQILNADFKSIRLDGTLKTQNLNFVYNDSTKITANQADIDIKIPSEARNAQFFELMKLLVKSPQINFEIVDFLAATLSNSTLNIGLSDITNDKQPFSAVCNYDMDNLVAKMDTIDTNVASPKGVFMMYPSKQNRELTSYDISLNSSKLKANVGKNFEITTAALALIGGAIDNPTEQNVLLRWSPKINAKINSIRLNADNIAQKVFIPIIDVNLTLQQATINRSRFVIDNSDFNLSGIITNIDKYLRNEGMLTANVDFTSDKVDVFELMDLISGFGAKDTTQKAALTEKPQDGDKEPFMVPWNVDVTLNTKISHGKVGKTDIYDLGGSLIIKNGVMVLEQMGFSCDAAKMQLTAMYRSERKNHLFAGLDFHLLDIDIAKLLDMIPQIDTIVPMLKYFQGMGEFHLAAETYLKSNYDIKYSTIRGASAVQGKNLVLLDNATFNEIAKALMFRKKTKNVVDSLSVELTVFRDEVELFPFVFSMDKYQVVMQGKYNLAKNYIAYAEALSPIRLGLQLSSTESGGFKLNPFKDIKLFGLKYGHLLQPEKRNAVENQVIAFKQMISDALKRNVKPQ
ncbi:MAG: hypothetical protein LBT04_08785 [Prevotellaceae bacterium]|jgi:hypothetical protein|nr:hypothetical protein [Prevotellaceae bacterium]